MSSAAWKNSQLSRRQTVWVLDPYTSRRGRQKEGMGEQNEDCCVVVVLVVSLGMGEQGERFNNWSGYRWHQKYFGGLQHDVPAAWTRYV
jgi:hypothetical protein